MKIVLTTFIILTSGKVLCGSLLKNDLSDINSENKTLNVSLIKKEILNEKNSYDNRKIVGGMAVQDIREISYQVALVYGVSFCGGCIITKRHVLSAAHCFRTYFILENFEVSFGSVFFNTGQQRYIDKLFRHPAFEKKSLKNDIAIVVLQEAVKFSYSVKPIILEKRYVKPGARCFVSGWGSTDYTKSSGHSNQLNRVKVTIQEDKLCTTAYANKKDGTFIAQMMICAFDIGKDACFGDSGGPLVCDNKLVGIVSTGKGCAVAEYPGIYSNVSFHADWIRKTIIRSDVSVVKPSYQLSILFAIFNINYQLV